MAEEGHDVYAANTDGREAGITARRRREPRLASPSVSIPAWPGAAAARSGAQKAAGAAAFLCEHLFGLCKARRTDASAEPSTPATRRSPSQPPMSST
jgi:hypothetical protein